MADKLGVSLRGYQAYEQGKGVSWEKVEKLGDLAGVSPEWIMRGDDGTGENGRAPDEVLAALGRIEDKLDRLLQGDGITLAMELVPGGRRKTDPPAERKRRKAS
jgi:transcriptional regulator with XRE-family HTH domain